MRLAITNLMKLSCIALLTILTLSSRPACGQNGIPNQLNTGYPENSTFHGTEIENVQVQNGNLHVSIPIWSAKGRGLDTGYNFIYDNHGYTLHTQCFTSGGGFCQDTVRPDSLSTMALKGYGPMDYQFSSTVGTSINCGSSGGGASIFAQTVGKFCRSRTQWH